MDTHPSRPGAASSLHGTPYRGDPGIQLGSPAPRGPPRHPPAKATTPHRPAFPRPRPLSPREKPFLLPVHTNNTVLRGLGLGAGGGETDCCLPSGVFFHLTFLRPGIVPMATRLEETGRKSNTAAHGAEGSPPPPLPPPPAAAPRRGISENANTNGHNNSTTSHQQGMVLVGGGEREGAALLSSGDERHRV